MVQFSKGKTLTRSSKGIGNRRMNLLIVIAFAILAIFAVSAVEYQKLGSTPWEERPIEPNNQFYEGIFRARLDHFRPQNQERVPFVSVAYYIDGMGKSLNAFNVKNRSTT